MSAEPTPTGGWSEPEQVAWYLDRIGRLDARLAGEQMLAEVLPAAPRSVLDLGCGDGRLLELVLRHRPSVDTAVAVDISPPMLEAARRRFATAPMVAVRRWDLRSPITSLGSFDLIVSGFAIHHLEHSRKRDLLGEVAGQLEAGGFFANLEVVASSTSRWHQEFLAAIGRTDEDPEDRLASVDDQLAWMRAAGLQDVECLWRWRGFALLVGTR